MVNLNKQDVTVRLSLVTIADNKPVLDKIREFILSLLDEYSYLFGSNTKLVNILTKTPKGNNKAICILEIAKIDFICNILIPYFDSIVFRTKKISRLPRF